MTLLMVEAATTLRRLVRRRTVLAVCALDLGLLLYTAVVDRVGSARDALSAASALAALTVLVFAAGIVADDRAAGRLAVAGTHPAPRGLWVVGRWLAVFVTASAVLTVAAGVLLAAGGGQRVTSAVSLGWAAGLAYTAALAAVATALSCGVGSTVQTLTLVALLVVGAMPPEVALHALGGAWVEVARGLWALCPTPWALGRLHAWSLAGAAPAPHIAVSLVAQTAIALAAGARALERAELGARSVQ
jgi:hypothetical protein